MSHGVERTRRSEERGAGGEPPSGVTEPACAQGPRSPSASSPSAGERSVAWTAASEPRRSLGSLIFLPSGPSGFSACEPGL